MLYALHLQAFTARGVVKDAPWIAAQHEAVAITMSGGVIERCRGFNMDGTKANRKAMELLEEKYPHMVNLVCQAHSLELISTDLGNGRKTLTTTRGDTLQELLTLRKCLGDSEKIQAAVAAAQIEKSGKVRLLSSCWAHKGVCAMGVVEGMHMSYTHMLGL